MYGAAVNISYIFNSMDMDVLLGTMLGTILNYKRDPYVDHSGFLNRPNIDSSSCRGQLFGAKAPDTNYGRGNVFRGICLQGVRYLAFSITRGQYNIDLYILNIILRNP